MGRPATGPIVRQEFSFLLKYYLKKNICVYMYLFIWLRQVLLEACWIFVAACGLLVVACGALVVTCGI